MPSPAHVVAPALLALSLALPAAAGLKITVHASPAGSSRTEVEVIAVEPDRALADMATQSVIFRADLKLMWILQPAERSYLSVTEEQLARFVAEMAEIEALLGTFNPENRAKFAEAMAAGECGPVPDWLLTIIKSPSAPDPALKPMTLVRTGRKETINGWACTSYNAVRDGVTVRELWVTPFADFGVTAADLAVFRWVSEFMKIRGDTRQQGFFDEPVLAPLKLGEVALPGVPIRTVWRTRLGKGVREIVAVERGTIPPEVFNPPAGWTKK